MEISLQQAKIAHLSAQLLWDEPEPLSPESICTKISFIQLDSISTIARNQDVICFNRSSSYKENEIWKSLESGTLFEDWAHARCLLPIDDFAYYYAEMLRRREFDPWWQDFLKNHKAWPDQILKLVEENGPISVSDVQTPKGFPKSSGWNKPNRRIIDYLCTRGYLLVKIRKNFKPYYDLPERILENLPKDNDLPDVMEKFWFDIRTTLKAIGPASIHRLLQYKYIHKIFDFEGKKIQPRKLLDKAVKEGTLKEVRIKNQKANYYILPEQEHNIHDVKIKDQKNWRVSLLSPWDPALWSRESILSQYGFDYKMEVYVTKAKRQYGYYVMPILWGYTFVGRIEIKLDRKTKTLFFLQWYWEAKFKPGKFFWRALAKSMQRFCQFHNAEKLTLGNLQTSYRVQLKNVFKEITDLNLVVILS